MDLFKHVLRSHSRFIKYIFLFFFPRIVDFIIMYYKVINHTKANFSKPFSHISCILNFSSCVFCFLLIIFAFPDSKRACFTLDVIKDIILGKCVRNYVYFEEVHWQRKITRTALWKMHWSYKSNFLKNSLLTALS